MANALTNLTNEILAQRIFGAFTDMIAPLNAFASDFSDEAANRGNTIKVAFVEAADAATAFSGTYTMQDADATGKDITLDQHQFVSWSLTDLELANRSQLSLDMFVMRKANALASAVLQNVWALVTNANFGAAAFTGAAATFDTDDVADIREDCVQAKWPNVNRSLILDETYVTNLIKDDSLKDFSQSGSTATLREGAIGRVHGFDTFESTLIPANGENLVGFAAHPDAIYVAMRYLEPQANHNYYRVEKLTNESGMTLGYREWYDNDTGTGKVVIEALWGRLLGNGNAIKRMVSA